MSADTRAWLESFGIGDCVPSSASSVDGWLAAADGRPQWMLWGKAQPDTACPAHPLLCHMMDVTAVAARLITRVLPAGLRARFLGFRDHELTALKQVLFVIALHDMGKAMPAFVAKVDWARERLPGRGFDLNAPPRAAHHGDAGMHLVAAALQERGMPRAAARDWARAVAAHHGQFPTAFSQRAFRSPDPRELGRSPTWARARDAIVSELADLLEVPAFDGQERFNRADVVLLAGLTSVADWVGSMSEVFTYAAPPASSSSYWPVALRRSDAALSVAGFRGPSAGAERRSFAQLFPPHEPWPLHRVADEIAARVDGPLLAIVEAPMGEGKTEAALVLAEAAAAAGCDGLYVGLPTQATANQMFGRVKAHLERSRDASSTLILAHGEASLVDAFRQIRLRAVYDDEVTPRRGAVGAEEWFLSKKRRLLAPYGVGTVDQALMAVMGVPHLFVRLFGLAGKTVVLDEVHAYDTYTGQLLSRLVEWLGACGTTVVLLSATLPSGRRSELLAAYRRGAGWETAGVDTVPYPRVTVAERAASRAYTFASRRADRSLAVALREVGEDVDALAVEVVAAAREGGCVGWILNTVARAQAAREALGCLAPELAVRLLHARLLPDDRAGRQADLERWLGRDGAARPKSCVVVGTQVLEQSLDVDFDLMVTDVAPIDLVLQRAGRLWRHDRSERTRAAPELWISRPGGDADSASLDEVAIVYDELLLRQTLRLLDRVEGLELPDDIEPWVEEVYDDRFLDIDHPLHDAWRDHAATQLTHRAMAHDRAIASPSEVDLAQLKVFLSEDDDPLKHASRAETRLGRVSVKLVCLTRHDGELYAGSNHAPIRLATKPTGALIERLVRRSIGVSRPAVVDAVLQNGSPHEVPAWSDVPILRHRRLVVFEDGEATVGGQLLRLDDELGLVLP